MNHTKKLIVIIALALCWSGGVLFSQTIPLKHYSKKDGLAASFVTCILQDSSGFLWFGTEHGISRFNGKEFESFLDRKQEQINDYIMDLYEDRRGNLWIGTRRGGLIRMNSRGIKVYSTNHGLPSNRISAIAEDREGNFWVGTDLGLSLLQGKSFSNYTTKDGLIDDLIKDIAVDQAGNIWIATEKGVSLFPQNSEKGNRHFINYTEDNGLINNKGIALLIDHKGNVWIGTQGGITCMQKKGGKIKFVSYTAEDGLANDFVRCIREDRSNNIWIGTDNGISCLSPSPGKFTNYYSENGFLDDRIYTIFEDREGNLWFGTGMGVSMLQSLKIANYSVTDGLPNNVIWAIIEEKKGKYWIGTDKGLACYDGSTFRTYTTREGLISDSILNMLKDKSDNIWIATRSGLSVYSTEKGTFSNYTVAEGLPNEIVISLAEDRKGDIWVGTTNGLCRFRDGTLTAPDFNIKMTPSPIHAIMVDKRGSMWFSDTRGIWKISGKNARHYSIQDGLIHNDIYSIFEDSRGRIWIGTKRGLSCFNNGRFTNYSTDEGLSNNDCLFIIEDNQQNLWVGTVNGLNRFDGKSFKIYSDRDGLISSEMNQCTCLKDSQGNLWFGTRNGISRLNPRLDRINTVPPPVYITHVSVMGKERPLSGSLNLEYQENYLKFDFIGLCFTSPEDVVYKYRLEGTDREWFETKDRYISYPSLRPGHHVFKVIAKNNDGIESVKPAEFSFNISPPFWNTWWFRILSFLALLSLAVLIVLFNIRRIKTKMANEAKNKQLVLAQRMKLMGVLAGGAVHDLKNLLSIIIGYSNIVHENSEEVNEEEKSEAVEIIKNTADTAFQVVKQILAFTRQTFDETKAVNLADALDEILAILKVNIPLTMKILWKRPGEELLLYINPVKFKQVVMNLCLNAIQAMEDRGELKISLSKDPEDPGKINIEISDTGPGIPQELLDKIFEPLFTTKVDEQGAGLGLFVVKQIVEEYKGKIQVNSAVGEGTTFIISFPVQHPPIDATN